MLLRNVKKAAKKSAGLPPSVTGKDDSLYSIIEEAEVRTDPTVKPPAKLHFLAWKNLGLILCGLGLGCALMSLGSWFEIKAPPALTPESLAAMPDSATPLSPGPWGNLEVTPIFIEPPDEYLFIDAVEGTDRRWHFSGFTTGQLLALFQSADLTPAQLSELSDTSKWQFDQGAIEVSPSTDLILALSPKARKQIYLPMINDPSNMYHRTCYGCRADRFDDFFANSGLSNETIDLIKKLSFPYGRLIFFCDMRLVLDTLGEPEQKNRLLKTLFKKPSLLLRLHLTPDSDLDSLEHYWIRAGWGLDLRPMLESLAKLPKGARIDVAKLLPPVPSAELYTYPFPSLKPEDQLKDCRWTALNFFRDTPDDRFIDPKVVGQTLRTDYYPALTDPRYGDIVVLSKPNGEIIHLAVYIAANIVFTKNSGNFRDPFIFMTLSDLLDHFAEQIPEDETLTVTYLRNKYY
jgi:hypothetical protein